LRIPKADMATVMGPAIQELMKVTAEQGIGPAGPWFCHYFQMLPDEWDFEIAVPVLAPVAPVGRVQPGRMTAMRVVRAIASGPYEGLGRAWGELDAWVGANGLQASDSAWEVYRVGPESTADSSKWRTELNRPIL
jgi:effector-binding domain-containing protein